MPQLLKKVLISLGIFVVGVVALFFIIIRPPISINESNLPKLVQADFVDLSRITEISRFRSGAGHDFSSGDETCRSMKHYFDPPRNEQSQEVIFKEPPEEPTIDIFSPVDGLILGIESEHTPIGRQFTIVSTINPAYTFRLFHVHPAKGITAPMLVKAGQKIGVIGAHQGTDIAVEVRTLTNSQRFVSYFEVMPDSLFAKYQAKGIKDRSNVVETKEYRDAHPFECTHNESDAFVRDNQTYDNHQDYVELH